MMTAAGCRQCGGVGIWKPLITFLVLAILGIIGTSIGFLFWKFDPQNADTREEVYQNVIVMKRNKMLRANRLGDPFEMSKAKAEYEIAELRYKEFKAEQEKKKKKTNEEETQDDDKDSRPETKIDMNPLVGAGSGASSRVGTGAGGTTLNNGPGEVEEADEEEEDADYGESGDTDMGANNGPEDIGQGATDGAESFAGNAEDGGGDLSRAMEQVSVSGKIILSYLQCTSVAVVTMPSIPWPESVLNLLGNVYAFSSFDFTNMIPVGCMTRLTYYEHFMLIMWLPAIIISCIFLVLLVNHIRWNGLRWKSTSEAVIGADPLWKGALMTLFILFPIMALRVLAIFDCREIDGDFWLVSDVQLKCYDTRWATYAIVGFCGALVYPVGIPILFYIILSRNKHRLDTPGVKARCGFLYSGFVAAFWGGELIEMFRKFFMSTFVVFVKTGSMSQMGVVLVVSALFLGLHLACDPYEDALENRVQTVSMWGTALTMFIAFLMTANKCSDGNSLKQKDNSETFFAVLLVLVNVFTLFGSLSIIAYEILVEHLATFFELVEVMYESYVAPMLEDIEYDDLVNDGDMNDGDVGTIHASDGSLGMAMAGAGLAGAGFVTATDPDDSHIPAHVLSLSQTVFAMFQENDNPGIDRQGLLALLHIWDHTEYTSIASVMSIFRQLSEDDDEIFKEGFIPWAAKPEFFGSFTPQTCQEALKEFIKTPHEIEEEGVPVYRKLWITQLFNAHAKHERISYHSFYDMMCNFSHDVNPVLVKATFKRMALVEESDDEAKRRMKNALRTDIDGVDDDYDVMRHGISREQFVKWAAAVFLNCDAEEFVEGIEEMIVADGEDVRRRKQQLANDTEDDTDEFDQEPSCGPLETLDFGAIFESIRMAEPLDALTAQSKFSIWRSIKGRQLTSDMVVSGKLHFTRVAALLESKRRQLTVKANPTVNSQVWPPLDAEAKSVAKRVLPEVFDSLDAITCSEIIRKGLVLEYIRQVNSEKYSSSALKDQMQALVLATTEVIVDKMSEEAYVVVANAYVGAL